MVEKTKEKMGSFCSVCSSSSLTGGSSFWPRVKNTRRRKSSKVEEEEDESSNYLKEERERKFTSHCRNLNPLEKLFSFFFFLTLNMQRFSVFFCFALLEFSSNFKN